MFLNAWNTLEFYCHMNGYFFRFKIDRTVSFDEIFECLYRGRGNVGVYKETANLS